MPKFEFDGIIKGEHISGTVTADNGELAILKLLQKGIEPFKVSSINRIQEITELELDRYKRIRSTLENKKPEKLIKQPIYRPRPHRRIRWEYIIPLLLLIILAVLALIFGFDKQL